MTNDEINDLTDEQINVMVTKEDRNLSDHWILSGDKSAFYHYGLYVDGCRSVKIADYCNDVNAMWPIIVDCKINLISPVRDLWAASWTDGGGKWNIDDCKHHDQDPLRAAAIVYLKIKGVL